MGRLYKNIGGIFVVLITLLFVIDSQTHFVLAEPFQEGDVFAGIGDGLVQHYDANGNLLETLNTAKGNGVFTTGCAFDAGDNLYITTFNGGDVIKFSGPDDPHTNLGTFGSGYSGSPESIVFDSVGNVYVGAVDGDNDIRKFDPNGNPLAQFNVSIDDRGSDWIDLFRDQRTMFYTSEGKRILRYDVVDDVQLSDFVSSLPGSVAYALRILPDDSVLVADTEFILRLDSSGNEIQRYDVSDENTWFSLNLDPDGTSFWAGNFGTGKFYKFDIEAGGDPLLSVDTGAGNLKLFGICVFGERTEALADTDGDGLLDDWEENGFDFDGDGNPDVDLPGMGANKDHKDIFVYVDWIEKSGLLGHSHKPSDDAINKVVEAFANAPVDNPDNETGINLHVVFGSSIEETTGTSGNQELGSVIGSCNYNWSEFDTIKFSSFSADMWPIFHYVIFGHHLPDFPCVDGRPSGISRNATDFQGGASDFIVALGNWETFFGGLVPGLTNARAGTFMHELGHNLGLGHGGLVLDDQGQVLDADHINYKPNHISVMNYSFSTRGLRKKGFLGLFWNGNFDYSRFGPNVLPDLVETNLSEPNGLGAGDAVEDYGTRYYCQGTEETKTIDGLQQAVDWNCDGDEEDTNVSTNINKDEDDNENPILSTLVTANEWQHLNYEGGAVGVFGVTIELPEVTSMAISPEITFEEDQKIGPFEDILVATIDIKPGSCPNPLNVKSKGVLPLAVLGIENFDVTTIDPATIRLSREGIEGDVAPLRWSYEDVATPFAGKLCDCHDLNGDGFMDLTLKLNTQELVGTLNLEEIAGETIPFTLTGNLKEEYGSTPIEGKDCIWVK